MVIDTQKTCQPEPILDKTFDLQVGPPKNLSIRANFGLKHLTNTQESGGQVVLAGGTVVTLVNAATKCIRKVLP